ncbi:MULTISPECIES: recombinase family protein [unclassified Flavobacterium]|uniref:recombinase family protein n=1 Tax=unclassified Flavobacterium TaxID=196869 RepID=UPI003F906B83
MGIESFKKFQKEKITEKAEIKEIWGYTRVSSKGQLVNNSLEEQRSEIVEFANKNGYALKNILGGTYESASGDFTRKEFMKLLDEVKGAKQKPFAIAIKFISRFSRTGGSAITIVHELVDKLGVHLIETSSGLCTNDEYSKLDIYNKLLDARRENMDRLEKTIPGMKALLRAGNWLGKAPRGYTMRGKKVTNYALLNETQSITINDEGEVLKKAWVWKLRGERDFVIKQKLEALNLIITKQALSSMWRNPFYCGVLVNSLIDEPIKGNWEGLVSQEDFWLVDAMLSSNKRSAVKEYVKSTVSEFRPLTGFLRCECGCLLTSYEVRIKNKHYYKCQKCKNASFNASTTNKSINEGLNDSFENLLSNYTLGSSFIEPFKLQLNKLFDAMNAEAKAETNSLMAKKKDLETKVENLDKRYFENPNFGDEKYNKYVLQFEAELKAIEEQIDMNAKKLSNHKIHVEKVVEKIKNISDCWGRGDVENKIRIQKLVFPEGLSIRAENREYLTKKINSVFAVIPTITGGKKGIRKEKTHQKVDGLLSVAGTGLEPVTFGL